MTQESVNYSDAPRIVPGASWLRGVCWQSRASFATMFGEEINDIRADSRKNEFGTFVD